MTPRTNSCRTGSASDFRIVASFGDAELVKHFSGRYELHGGSPNDHGAAREWISLFLHEAVVSSPPHFAAPAQRAGFVRLGPQTMVRRDQPAWRSPR
jgi:hypothetical protein